LKRQSCSSSAPLSIQDFFAGHKLFLIEAGRTAARSTGHRRGVKCRMIADEGGYEVAAVVVRFLHPQGERDAMRRHLRKHGRT
jgi:hypothetical protein